jgi:hypothetical protein
MANAGGTGRPSPAMRSRLKALKPMVSAEGLVSPGAMPASAMQPIR